jgi:hypothetical protein
MVERRAALHPGGVELGWEVLAHDIGGWFHSWLCHGVERVASDRLGLHPGPRGLLSSEADARAVAKIIDREELGEPLEYFPCIVLKYEDAA